MNLSKNDRERYINLLTTVYEEEIEKVEKLNDQELYELDVKHQESQIKKSKNPNRFFMYYKGLPEPKEYKPTTSKKYGLIIVIIFFSMFVVLFIILMYLALQNHS